MASGYQMNIEDRASSYADMSAAEKQRLRREVLRDPDVQESVEDMRERLQLMKTIVDDTRQVMSSTHGGSGGQEAARKGIAIDGAMMGAIFTVILAVILGASVHAFQNLYQAVMKRYGARS